MSGRDEEATHDRPNHHGPGKPVPVDDYGRALHWQSLAACLEVDPEIFFPEVGYSAGPAKAVCAACLVESKCLAYALANRQLHGVWGGTTERERREIRKQQRSTPKGAVA